MKYIRLLVLTLLAVAAAQTAWAEESALGQLQDISDTSGDRSNEDSSDNAGAGFDGTPSGAVQDPSSLQPGGTYAEPNSDE